MSVEQSLTRDGTGTVENIFAPGDAIQYAASVNNHNGNTVEAKFNVRVINPKGIVIFNSEENKILPTGVVTIYTSSTIGADGLAGTYTVQVTVIYNNLSSSGQNQFMVIEVAKTLKITTVLTADAVNPSKDLFIPGNVIHYIGYVSNTGNKPINAQFHFEVFGPNQIYNRIFTDIVPPGSKAWSEETTVPSTAPAGKYTLQVTVSYNGQSTKKQDKFTVMLPVLQEVKDSDRGFWAGYIVKGTNNQPEAYYNVKGSWIVPTAICSQGESSGVGFFVGLGGTEGKQLLEQIGTATECVRGQSNYYAWYEMVPADPITIKDKPVSAGDEIQAEVNYLGNGHYSFKMINVTQRWSFGIIQLRIEEPGTRTSAEWIVEPRYPMPHFYTDGSPIVQFSNCFADSEPISIGGPVITKRILFLSKSLLLIQPSNLIANGSAFTIEWKLSS